MASVQDTIVDDLMAALRGEYPVTLHRRRGLSQIAGYIISVSGHWVAVHALADSVYADGYEVIRRKDIAEVSEHRRSYVERVVTEVGRPEPDFVLPPDATVREVLKAASEHSLLTCIQLEDEEFEPMLVGRIVGLTARKYELHMIDPQGHWDDEVDTEWYGGVTRVTFADRYSRTLETFGDPLPRDTAAS